MITEKRSHFGMAGHFAAMPELLLRGYNVAVLSVDEGDDVLVLDDQRGSLRRVQVRTADGEEERGEDARILRKVVKCGLSRQQGYPSNFALPAQPFIGSARVIRASVGAVGAAAGSPAGG